MTFPPSAARSTSALFLACALLVAAPLRDDGLAAHEGRRGVASASDVVVRTPRRPAAFRRTETRTPCASYDPLRQPFFGDLHVHTRFSWDAYVFGNTIADPNDAYAFARGEPRPVPYRGGTRVHQLRRPLHFAAVTDHAEYFGEVRICLTPGAPGYDSFHCRTFRGEESPPLGLSVFNFWGINLAFPAPPISTCATPGADCDAAAASVWEETQRAAEAAYDRSAACSFTSFVAYEYTGATGGFNGHRNVIFRNHRVPDFPISAFETGGTDPPALWRALDEMCLRGRLGCDVLAIPHNSNLSGGTMFPAPETIEEAATRSLFEPLAEISQIKGSSECRFDRLVGRGAGTEDELCAYEQRLQQMQVNLPPAVFIGEIDQYPRSNLLRNVLKDGLAIERRIGANPFKLGFIGSTDTHNGIPGAVDEDDAPGAHGSGDDDPRGRIVERKLYDNPGALAVVWAEENSRDSLFEAMRRREVYATSGTRPIVRLFGGFRVPADLCEKRSQLARAYRAGVPMGSDLPRYPGRGRPRFYVSALKDAGTAERPGVDLQRIQIIKGWVDAAGETHETVVDVVGAPDGDASVGRGASGLCTVWEDASFDPTQHAFYYARVLENPSCRWSTYVCKELGVDPFSPTCLADADAAGTGLRSCCLDERSDAFVSPVTQERAWTSPIWYRPASRGRERAS
jgi:hypothetical protein